MTGAESYQKVIIYVIVSGKFFRCHCGQVLEYPSQDALLEDFEQN